MKRFCFIGMFIVFYCSTVYADTRYVVDILQITMRSGPGNDYKILAMLQSGQKLEVIESGDEWSNVRLDNGKEGWVLNQYISSEKTSKLVLEKLEKDYKKLLLQFDILLEQNENFKKETAHLTSELSNTKKMLSHTATEYDTLKTDSADFLKLKAEHNQAVAELAEKTDQVDTLNEKLRARNIYLLLTGAGVLLFGFIIGLNTRSQRRKSSLL